MICDHIGCRNQPARAPRLVVPSRTPLLWGHSSLKMMTTLHYCEPHRGEIDPDDLLTGKVKAEFEALARKQRPLGFQCDFEYSFVEYVLVTTPEYREWLTRLDLRTWCARNERSAGWRAAGGAAPGISGLFRDTGRQAGAVRSAG